MILSSRTMAILTNAPASTPIPVVDLSRAREFYEGTLGLTFKEEDQMGGAYLSAGGDTKVYLYTRGATKADHTVLAFEVEDLLSTVNELKTAGVTFEEYEDEPINTDENSIAWAENLGIAWFKDTEGNILAVGSKN